MNQVTALGLLAQIHLHISRYYLFFCLSMATKSRSKAAAAYRPVKGNDKLELAVDPNQPELTGSKQQPTKAAPLQLVASNPCRKSKCWQQDSAS
jgi:hypothetical protein